MTLRHYSLIVTFGLIFAALIPRMSPEEVMLRSGGEIVIFPAAGVTAWEGFTPLSSGAFVGDLSATPDGVRYKLGVGNELYILHVQCGAVQSITADHDFKPNHSVVLDSANWACTHRP